MLGIGEKATHTKPTNTRGTFLQVELHLGARGKNERRPKGPRKNLLAAAPGFSVSRACSLQPRGRVPTAPCSPAAPGKWPLAPSLPRRRTRPANPQLAHALRLKRRRDRIERVEEHAFLMRNVGVHRHFVPGEIVIGEEAEALVDMEVFGQRRACRHHHAHTGPRSRARSRLSVYRGGDRGSR